MATTNDEQATQPALPPVTPPAALLAEEDMDAVSAGDGGPASVPFCGIKPSRRATTQKLVDDIYADGGTVNSVDFETGKINFTLGPGIPAPEIPRD